MTADTIVSGEALTEAGGHATSPPFSKGEVALIREAVMRPAALVACPRCGSRLAIETIAGEVRGAGRRINTAKDAGAVSLPTALAP
jgi:hypothetical protein